MCKIHQYRVKKEFVRFQVPWIYSNGSLVSTASQWWCQVVIQETRCWIYCSKLRGDMGGALFRHPLKVLAIKRSDYLARIESILVNRTEPYLDSSLGERSLRHQWIAQAQDVSGERKQLSLFSAVCFSLWLWLPDASGHRCTGWSHFPRPCPASSCVRTSHESKMWASSWL